MVVDSKTAVLTKVILHQVGNKLLEEGVVLSHHPVDLERKENLAQNLKTYFLSSFREPVFYNFHHVTSLDLNEVYTIAQNIFDSRRTFVRKTQELAQILYEYSNHPRIKPGELCVAYFEECVLGNEVVEAVGLFKAENKETFLTIQAEENGFELNAEAGISINKPDKGCLIFNASQSDGYKVLVIDNQSSSEAQYWKDEFLKLRPVADNYHQTSHYLEIARNYVTGRLDEEFEVTKTDQIDYLNRSLGYFKNHEQFNELEFAATVFEHKDVIKSFRRYKNEFAEENELDIVSEFEISNHAVKKQSRVFKSVLKLDKNFHIYIHGDRDLIERGVEPDGRKYYKIYYREES